MEPQGWGSASWSHQCWLVFVLLAPSCSPKPRFYSFVILLFGRLTQIGTLVGDSAKAYWLCFATLQLIQVFWLLQLGRGDVVTDNLGRWSDNLLPFRREWEFWFQEAHECQQGQQCGDFPVWRAWGVITGWMCTRGSLLPVEVMSWWRHSLCCCITYSKNCCEPFQLSDLS